MHVCRTQSPHATLLVAGRGRALAIACALALLPLAASAQTAGDPPLGKPLLEAMQRDLGLNPQQAAQYVRAERSAIALAPRLRSELGATYAGSWLEQGKDGRFRLVVATTDPAGAAKARALGAEARIAARSLAELQTAKARLDGAGRQSRAPAGLHSWYVDERRNQVVIEGLPQAQRLAGDFASINGIDPLAVRFVASEAAPKPAEIVGGNRYNMSNGSWCSIGFPVTQGANTGFATAGHCGTVNTTTTGTNGISQGVFAASTFPGNDSAWVRITNTASWPLRNWVNNYAGGTVQILGQAQAPVGAAICRSGARTGYRCGVVNANNVTVNYSAGAVFGLTSTSACVGFGDSGGAYITPAGQAQGVTSGGQFFPNTTDNCASNPPVSFHQPIVPLLNQYGLTLFTGGGGGGTAPVITSFVCPNRADSGGGQYFCNVRYTPTNATVSWSGASGQSSYADGFGDFFGTCVSGQTLRLTVTVSTSAGSVSRTSSSFSCPTGPIP